MPIKGHKHRLMEDLMVQRSPHPHAHTALGQEDAPHFLDAVAAIGKEFETVLTEHDVKGRLWEGEGHRTALAVGQRRVLGSREGVCHLKHTRIDI
jgi:hypothetical protein